MTFKICVSILPETSREALTLIERAENHNADFIEVRLDCLRDHDKLVDIAAQGKVPMIATNRSIRLHGGFRDSETERKKILMKAARDGFEYVDVELSVSDVGVIVKQLHDLNVKSIVSFHDFTETPSSLLLERVLKQEIACGAQICKIVTTAKSVTDNLSLLDFVSRASNDAQIICFAMGNLGKPSRLFSPMFGAIFTFASLGNSQSTAPGQLTIQEMKTIFKTLGLT